MGAIVIKKISTIKEKPQICIRPIPKSALKAGPHPRTALECISEESFEESFSKGSLQGILPSRATLGSVSQD